MVDWSKYDDEAHKAVMAERQAAKERASLLERLKEISRSHAERLVAAGAHDGSGKTFDPRIDQIVPTNFVWLIGSFALPPHGYRDFYMNREGVWHAYIPSVWYETDLLSYRGEIRHEGDRQWTVDPPLLDEDKLAMELSKHYFRATGK